MAQKNTLMLDTQEEQRKQELRSDVIGKNAHCKFLLNSPTSGKNSQGQFRLQMMGGFLQRATDVSVIMFRFRYDFLQPL